jgi:hypothetical protein
MSRHRLPVLDPSEGDGLIKRANYLGVERTLAHVEATSSKPSRAGSSPNQRWSLRKLSEQAGIERVADKV